MGINPALHCLDSQAPQAAGLCSRMEGGSCLCSWGEKWGLPGPLALPFTLFLPWAQEEEGNLPA